MAIDTNSSAAASTTTSSAAAAAAAFSVTPNPSTSTATGANAGRGLAHTAASNSRPVSPLAPHHQATTATAVFSAHQALYTAQPLPIRAPVVSPPYTNPQFPKTPHEPSSPGHGIPYPVASSGRGFIPKPLRPDQTVTIANPGAYPPRSVVPGFHHAASVRPHLDSLNVNHMVRPLHNFHHHHHHFHPHLASAAAPVKGVPVSVPTKVASSSSVPDCNGHKDMRDKSRDDSLTTIRDRKVRLVEGASLYALCQSWLRNGFPEESQPQYGDGVRSLPKPSAIPVATANLQKNKEGEEENDDGGEEKGEESVKHLSAEDLLKGHVKRAKRVRARLREVRLKRIARYKSRLALLLPPLVEQFRNDSAAGT